jgi:membrane fusion protein (multidrug efflux system)
MIIRKQSAYLAGVLILLFSLMISACSDQGDSPDKNKKKRPVHLVETAAVLLDSVGLTQTRNGTLTPQREVKIYNQEEGAITQLPFFEGDHVNKGDVIVRLDDRLLRAELVRAEASLRKAKLDLDRIKDLYRKKLSSEEVLNRSETDLAVAQADVEMLTTRLGYTEIRSPIDGVISQRLSEPGNIAERYTHLLTISDHSSLFTEVHVSELLVSHLQLGDTVKVTVDALGSEEHTGRISRIHPNLDPLTRRGTVEVTLDPVPAGARPGQLCRVEFNTRTAERLVIPFRALRRDTDGEYVFVIDGDKAMRRDIDSGLRIGEQIEVLKGLEAGQHVVTKGFLDLVDGKTVRDISLDRETPETLPGV